MTAAMLRHLSFLPIVLAAAVAAAPAQATPESDQDLRCFAVGLSLMETKPDAGLTTAMYFLGRLEGREPQVDWYEKLASHMATLTPERLAADAQVCGKILMDKGAEMTRRGEDLERRAEDAKRRGKDL